MLFIDVHALLVNFKGSYRLLGQKLSLEDYDWAGYYREISEIDEGVYNWS